jgi:hypothetical protein
LCCTRNDVELFLHLAVADPGERVRHLPYHAAAHDLPARRLLCPRCRKSNVSAGKTSPLAPLVARIAARAAVLRILVLFASSGGGGSALEDALELRGADTPARGVSEACGV